MAETVIEKAVCGSCGAVVREEASFCYGCGEPVSLKQPKNKRKILRKGSRNGRPVKEADPVADQIVAEKPVVEEKPLVAESEEADPTVLTEPILERRTVEAELAAEDRAKLRSAASISKRARTFERQPLEVVWVQRENPSMAFIVVSLMLVVLAAVLLALALYLK